MAKMFLTVPEAAKIIGCTEKQVHQWFADGRLQEFKDRCTSMAKTEQVNLLAEEYKKEQSRPGSGVISVGVAEAGLEIEAEVGSGSGLLDLTRESDDTSLGADLLEDVYSNDEPQKDREGATSRVALPPMEISAKRSPWPGIAFLILLFCMVTCLVLTFVYKGDEKPKQVTHKPVEAAPLTLPSSSSLKYKISIMLGDKVYKTIIVSKPVKFVNGGVSWTDDKGYTGYCSGQFLVEAIEENQ